MYVERFVGSHAADIRGRVLEIAAPDYTNRYGSGVERVDILMAKEGNPEATIVGDLADAPQIPSDTFDCAIVTQTLQFVYDVRAALATLHRILAPGGVLLATVPGITKISPPEDEEYGEWWHYTGRSARRLAEEAFGEGNVEVETYGNVSTAAGFLYGLAASDLSAGRARCARPPVRGDRRRARSEAARGAPSECRSVAFRLGDDHLMAPRRCDVLAFDEAQEGVDRRPRTQERIAAAFVPCVVVEDEDSARTQHLPRERGVDEHVEASMRAVDIHEVEPRVRCEQVEQDTTRIADALLDARCIDQRDVRIERRLQIGTLLEQIDARELGIPKAPQEVAGREPFVRPDLQNPGGSSGEAGKSGLPAADTIGNRVPRERAFRPDGLLEARKGHGIARIRPRRARFVPRRRTRLCGVLPVAD